MAQQPKGANSILEGLSQVMASLAQLSVLPDAAPHLPFVNALMNEIQQYLHKPQVAGQALDPGQAAGAGAAPGGGSPGPPQGPPDMGPPPQGIQNMGPPTPNPDELRRLLAVAGRSA